MKAKYFLFLLVVSAGLLTSCSDDDPSLFDRVVGDWEVTRFIADGGLVTTLTLSFEFDDDGDFDLNLSDSNGNNAVMSGEWEVDEGQSELELNYDVQSSIFVGLAGFLVGQDLTREEYDLEFDSNDEIILDGTTGGVNIELELERD